MIPWHERTLVAFDTEATGTDPETARIVTAAVVTVDPATGKVARDEWLVDPGVEIPEEATQVHGVTTEHARTFGMPAAEAVRLLVAHLADAAESGWPVVIYNASYDLTVLDREARRYELSTLTELCESDRLTLFVVDPLVIDRETQRYRKGKRDLTTVCGHYGITLTAEEAHTAAGDALASARLAWKQARRFAEVGGIGLAELQQRQATWHAQWAAHYEDYRRSKGETVRIDRSWPIRHAAAVTS